MSFLTATDLNKTYEVGTERLHVLRGLNLVVVYEMSHPGIDALGHIGAHRFEHPRAFVHAHPGHVRVHDARDHVDGCAERNRTPVFQW